MYCLLLFILYHVGQQACALEISESTGERVECDKSKVDHNVTLAGGYQAGLFLKANKSITSMESCVKQCCQMNGCDVAFFNNGACYSVKCRSLEFCAPKSNLDKRMKIAISYVAKPKSYSQKGVSSDETGEPAIVDNLIAEVVSESPFKDELLFDDKELNEKSDKPLLRSRRGTWKEAKDIVVAVACGFIAIAVGVIGVITMTRKLVEEDEVDYNIVSAKNENTVDMSFVNVTPKSKNTFVRKPDSRTSENTTETKQISRIPIYQNYNNKEKTKQNKDGNSGIN